MKSEMAEDNVTILCDGYWRRVYLRPESEWDWGHVAQKLDTIDQTASAINFPLLEAAAIRTRIMLLAEWQHRIGDAVELAEASLRRFGRDDCRFLISEVTGRQLAYANRKEEAIQWLNQALSCDGYQKSLWRRNVFITLADLWGQEDPKKAVDFTRAAAKMAGDGALTETIFIETLVEHGIALWRADERLQCFRSFAEVVNRVFGVQAELDSWKGLFSRIFYVLSYYSDVAQHGNEQPKYTEPEQGLFLSTNDKAHTFYKEEQKSYICIRLAMFADGVRDLESAAAWTWRAIEHARHIPEAWTGARLPSYYAMPAALLANDFGRASELASILMSVDSEDIAAITKVASATASPDMTAKYEVIARAVPSQSKSSALRVIPILPLAIRLMFLKLHGSTIVETSAHIKVIRTAIPAEIQPRHFGAALEEALVNDTDWQRLQQGGFEAISKSQFSRGLILCLGAMEKAPIVQSLYLQTYLAQQFEGWFGTTPSIYREIVAPMFKAYWERAVANLPVFRTGLSYTTRQLEAADGTPIGTRKLLNAMRFCTGSKLPDQTMAWLEPTDD
jgi:hypothetical protein